MGSVFDELPTHPRKPQTADNSCGINHSLCMIKLCRSCTFQEACTRDRWGSSAGVVVPQCPEPSVKLVSAIMSAKKMSGATRKAVSSCAIMVAALQKQL